MFTHCVMHNPDFKPIEFEGFKNKAGANAFTMSPKKWIESTNAIGIISKSGRYGGTFAHSDIAFEFASWVSPEFKLYIIKDYKRLRQIYLIRCYLVKLQKSGGTVIQMKREI